MALNTQVWVNQIKKNFYPEGDFILRTIDYTSFVETSKGCSPKLHIPSTGIDPAVLINNNTYPISKNLREDEDNEITLDKFETENTIVRRPEALEYSFDMLESVIKQHRLTLQTATRRKAIHAIAPLKDTKDTPVINTTGEIFGERKRLSHIDILMLKERFDDALIPLNDRVLVLHPKHVSDLLYSDIKLFKDLTNLVDGTPFKFAGFAIYQFPYMPIYNTSNQKLPYDSKDSGTFASVAFQSDEVMRADGEVFMYSRENDPEERGTIVGFDKRFICMPIRNKGIGAILSASK